MCSSKLISPQGVQGHQTDFGGRSFIVIASYDGDTSYNTKIRLLHFGTAASLLLPSCENTWLCPSPCSSLEPCAHCPWEIQHILRHFHQLHVGDVTKSRDQIARVQKWISSKMSSLSHVLFLFFDFFFPQKLFRLNSSKECSSTVACVFSPLNFLCNCKHQPTASHQIQRRVRVFGSSVTPALMPLPSFHVYFPALPLVTLLLPKSMTPSSALSHHNQAYGPRGETTRFTGPKASPVKREC